MARLQSWYDSDDYAEALIVNLTATRRLFFVPGVEVPDGT